MIENKVDKHNREVVEGIDTDLQEEEIDRQIRLNEMMSQYRKQFGDKRDSVRRNKDSFEKSKKGKAKAKADKARKAKLNKK